VVVGIAVVGTAVVGIAAVGTAVVGTAAAPTTGQQANCPEVTTFSSIRFLF